MTEETDEFIVDIDRRMTGGEEARFRRAFYEVLARNPDQAPGPTAINRALGRTGKNRVPLNVLNGRMSVLRRQLLLEAGFSQAEKWARWEKK